jgi:LDH2 family malate/lactate/ureidoglycolate dehydrogenase
VVQVIAIDASAFTDGFEAKAAAVCGAVKAAGPGGGGRLPGESAQKIRAKNLRSGMVPVPNKIWDVIQKTAESGLPAE